MINPLKMEINESFFIGTKIGPFADAKLNNGTKIKSRNFFDLEAGKIFNFSKNWKTGFSLELMYYSYKNDNWNNYSYINPEEFEEFDVGANWYMYYYGVSKKFIPYFGFGIFVSPLTEFTYNNNFSGNAYYSYYRNCDSKEGIGDFALQFKLGFQYYVSDDFSIGLEYTANNNEHYYGSNDEIKVRNNLNTILFKIRFIGY